MIFPNIAKCGKGREVQAFSSPSLYGTKTKNIKNQYFKKLLVSCNGLSLNCKHGFQVLLANGFGHLTTGRGCLQGTISQQRFAYELTHVDILVSAVEKKKCFMVSAKDNREESLAELWQVPPLMSTSTLK